jgi:hypothetical protein
MGFLAPLAMVASAVGTGVSFIGAMQQARASEAIAGANAQIQNQNAQMQSATLRAQAEIQRQQAAANLKLRQGEAGARFGNADALRQRALAQDAINAANLRKKREAGARLTATQRAKYAAAGIVDSTGSPLSLLAETEGIIQRDLKEEQYHNELVLSGLFHEAAMERLGGEYALAGATFDYDASKSEARLRDASATATLISGRNEAEMTRLGGRAQASGYRFGGMGNLLSGASNAAGQYMQFKQWGAFGA